MTVSTLLMGFTVTGGMVSLSYAGSNQYTTIGTSRFMKIALECFSWAFVSLSVSLVLSIIGAELHAQTPDERLNRWCCNCGPRFEKGCPCYGLVSSATVFFKVFAPLFLLAEIGLYSC